MTRALRHQKEIEDAVEEEVEVGDEAREGVSVLNLMIPVNKCCFEVLILTSGDEYAQGCHGTKKYGNLDVQFSTQGNVFLHREFTSNMGKILKLYQGCDGM